MSRYDDFRVKIAAGDSGGQGPDVVQLFYGVAARDLPQGGASPAACPRADFTQRRSKASARYCPGIVPADGKWMRQGNSRGADGPSRSLCASSGTSTLFQGSRARSRTKPLRPTHSTSSTTYARTLTTAQPATGDLIQGGLTIDNAGGQDHHWLREVVPHRQFGGAALLPNDRKERWAYQQPSRHRRNAVVHRPGQDKQKVGNRTVFLDRRRQPAFRSGKAGRWVTIDGSFRTWAVARQSRRASTIGVTEPAVSHTNGNHSPTSRRTGVNGITTKATGAKALMPR
jgi:multiple sugar transport system substrate-binding protein